MSRNETDGNQATTQSSGDNHGSAAPSSSPAPEGTTRQHLITAAREADWGQVVANGGPPCFHLMPEGRLCLRAKRWEGHKGLGADHAFVSLDSLLTELAGPQ